MQVFLHLWGVNTDQIQVEAILAQAPEDKQPAFRALHETIVAHLPSGFAPGISYGGLGYVVPHALYPAGYHCKPAEPLPFAGIACSKNAITLYHMGLYADPVLMDWFTAEYSQHSARKLDMGKSCIRFKRPDEIPLTLIGQLMERMSVAEWIALYEQLYKQKG